MFEDLCVRKREREKERGGGSENVSGSVNARVWLLPSMKQLVRERGGENIGGRTVLTAMVPALLRLISADLSMLDFFRRAASLPSVAGIGGAPASSFSSPGPYLRKQMCGAAGGGWRRQVLKSSAWCCLLSPVSAGASKRKMVLVATLLNARANEI